VQADGTENLFLYDLSSDPGEKMDLATARPEIAAMHRQLLQTVITRRVLAPIRPRVQDADGGGEALGWLRPIRSGAYSYEELAGNFILQWSGAADREYLVDYRAGHGRRELAGTLAVRGTVKDFGWIDRRYWQTWIVPNSPFRLRVREANGPGRTSWLLLEARP
jgi:hypothetical protein